MKGRFSFSSLVGVLFSLALVGLMFYALGRHPGVLPSQLVGKPAPLFVATASDGTTVNLKELMARSQWLVLNFWSTTCVVCREEAPELQRLYAASQAPQSRIQFVSVNIQEPGSDVLRYLSGAGLSYRSVLDESGKISLDYGVTGTPETFFVDPKGLVRHRVAGAIDADGVFRFVDWLEKNPSLSPEEAMQGYSQALSGEGRPRSL